MNKLSSMKRLTREGKRFAILELIAFQNHWRAVLASASGIVDEPSNLIMTVCMESHVRTVAGKKPFGGFCSFSSGLLFMFASPCVILFPIH